ncbi:hypothetical protein BLA29_009116 [Euroglyphus maynei]|uniref:Uncharacterized protein n=1 Tax=Euroglyphus maynei TaxID=6958 RepID=A0A1Y3BB56_EURMA|nr:hypothetical protein BLA29_009116 [Euroglyphus maynei]
MLYIHCCLAKIESAQQQLGFRRIKRGYKSLVLDEIENLQLENDPNDPLFEFQWYLKNTGQNGGKPRLDLNVEAGRFFFGFY